MREITGCFFFFLSLSCFAGEPVIQIQCNCQKSDLQLSYLSDAVVYKSERISPIEDSVNVFSFRLKIEKPVLAEILGHVLLVFPDDNVRITVTEVNGTNQWKIKGKNSENYSFMDGLKAIPKFDVFSWKFDDTFALLAFKAKANEHYVRTLSYHQAYITEHKTSERFNHYTQLLLKTLYLQNLMYPVYNQNLLPTQLPEGYLSDINSEFLNQPELTGYRNYIMLLSNYTDYLILKQGRPYLDSTWVLERIQFYKENLTGDLRSDMILFMFSNLVMNGSLGLSATIDQVRLDLLDLLENNAAKRKQTEALYKRFQILGRKLPDEVLMAKLIDEQGKTILLSELLAQSDKLIYIDFWASWCGPCKEEMPASQKLYQQIKTDIPVDFVYISLDKISAQWKKGIQEIAVSGKHYLLSKDFKSELVQYIGFNSIPRYILLDVNGILIDYDAPRPSRSAKLIQTFKSVQYK